MKRKKKGHTLSPNNASGVVWAHFCHKRTIVVVVVVAKDVVMSMVKYLVSEKSNKQYKKTYYP